MSSFDTIFGGIAKIAEQNAMKEIDGMYIGKDGLYHCKVCNYPKQCKVTVCGREEIVFCTCKCDWDEQKAYEERRKENRREVDIERLKREGFENISSEKMWFSKDDGGNQSVMKMAKNYCKRFKDYQASGTGLIIYGDVGTGKTFTAGCIANELISQGISVHMTNFATILGKVQENFDGRQKYIDELKKFKLLIIDDLGAERSTDYTNEIIFSVVDARYRLALPIIVTTNLLYRDMMNPSNIAKKRIFSRLTERCIMVEMVSANRRKQPTILPDDDLIFDETGGVPF